MIIVKLFILFKVLCAAHFPPNRSKNRTINNKKYFM